MTPDPRWRRLFPPVPRIKDRVSDDERVNPEVRGRRAERGGRGLL